MALAMTATAMRANELRALLKARIREEGRFERQVIALERWAVTRPDDEVADAIALVTIALDAPRKRRWLVLRTIADELRDRDDLLPHDERVYFLQWIVRGGETDAGIRAKLRELREAATPTARSRIVFRLLDAESPNASSNATAIARAHAILAHAWRAAPPEARPTGVAHRGEPEPFIGASDTVRLVLWLARRVEHLVPTEDQETFEHLLDLAEAAAAAGRPDAALREALEDTPKKGALGIARFACAEASAALVRPDTAGVAARPAAIKIVSLLLYSAGIDEVRTFLSDLDEELRRLDVAHALEERRKTSPSRPIARAIHRGAEGDEVVLWLAELEGGELGLLSKQGPHWKWTEGTRDDVLPLIPDTHFEAAAMAHARSSDSPRRPPLPTQE